MQKYEIQTVLQFFKMHAVNWNQNNSGILKYYLQLKKKNDSVAKQKEQKFSIFKPFIRPEQ